MKQHHKEDLVTPRKIKGFRAWLATQDGVFYVKKSMMHRMPYLFVNADPKTQTKERNKNEMYDARVSSDPYEGRVDYDRARKSLPLRFRDRTTLSPIELGELIGKSSDYARDLCRQRQVLYARKNGQYLIDVNSVLGWLQTVEEPEIEEVEVGDAEE